MLRFAAAALLASTAFARAATVSEGPATDADFVALCGGTCETAVAEIRAGRGGPGEWELDARGGSEGPNAQVDHDLASRTSYGFHVFYNQEMNKLAVGAGDAGLPWAYDTVSLGERFGETHSLFIRARGESGQRTELSDMAIGGQAIGGLVAVDGAKYLTVTDLDFGESFEITGTFFFDYQGVGAPRSRFATQFKFTDLPPEVAPVPVPAAGLLLLGRARRARRRVPPQGLAGPAPLHVLQARPCSARLQDAQPRRCRPAASR